MKKSVAGIAAAAIAAGALAVPALAATKSVQVKDNKFVANSITVKKGTTVKWVWKGKAPHDVTVTKGPAKFKSKVQTSGSFSKKLTKKGTYSIVCTIHAPGMKMTIKVK
ncbi:MAG TPA: plastocyanin/azurin family copper-binding protein [Baekduia sp.]|nr:plastocyanin/azurin family copper-binding protein [Baekduia sp.]